MFPHANPSLLPFAHHVLFAMPIPTTSSLNVVPSAHEPIHSGHFMTSNPHTEQPPDEDDEDVECMSCGYEMEISQSLSQVDVVEDDDKADAATDDRNFQKPVTFYKFGPKKTQSIAIDVSLNKLNKCIKVAYNKMTTPKWKDFKGLRLPWKQRIRLNNVIWRAYFLEFGRHSKAKRQKPFCYFSVPDDDTTHVKLEGSVLEGMYWKRKMEAVSAQYKKWRCFTRSKRHQDKDWRITHHRGRKRVGVCDACKCSHDGPLTLRTSSDDEHCGADAQRSMGEQAAGVHASGSMLPEPSSKLTRSQTPKNTSTEYFDIDDWENAFTDELFEQLNQPIQFPNPKDLFAYGYSDVIQPGLLGLQPSMEEILATLEPSSPTSPMEMEPIPTPQHSQQHQAPMPLSRSQSQQIASTSGQQQRNNSNGNMAPVQQHHQQQQHRSNQYSSQASQLSNRRMSTPPQSHMTQHQPVPQQGGSRAPQDYAVANMLLDYRNQPTGSQQSPALASQPSALNMPTRQSSSITSQMLMLSSQGVQPQYSTAIYNDQQRSWLGKSGGPVTAGLGTTPSVSTTLQGSFSLAESGLNQSFEYIPQFLQSQAGLIPAQTMQSMMTSSAQRNWWFESPLATTASSPSAATPLTPMTPLNLIGSTTPESLRSPVVRSTNQQQQDTNVMGLLTSQREELKPGSLHQRLEQPSLFAPVKTDSSTLFIPPPSTTKDCWNSSGNYSGAMSGQRSAPATAEVRTADGNPWKEVLPGTSLSSVPTPAANTPSGASSIYSPYGAGTSGLSGRDSALSHRIRRDTEDTEEGPLSVPPTKCEFKEEPPMSVPGAGGGKNRSRQVQADSTLHPEERKRILHLHAEQNRRSALKDGFDQLMELIPDLYGGGTKPTNAVVLAKSGEHIRRLQNNCQMQAQCKEELQEKIARLNNRISSLQSNLPSSSGISSTSGKLDPKANLEAFYDRYTRERSKADWRFWVMSKMMQPLIVGQPNSLASAITSERLSDGEIVANCSDWLQQHWRASELRPLASNLLVHLATQTNVLSDPASLEDHVRDQLKSHV